VGVALALVYVSQPTETEVVARRLSWLLETRDLLRASLEAEAPPAPAAPLSPPVRYAEDDPERTNNVEFVSAKQLDHPFARSGHFYPGGGDLLDMLRASGISQRVPDWSRQRASPGFERRCEHAAAARYVALYRILELEGKIEVTLVDLKQKRACLRRRVDCGQPRDILAGPRTVLEALREHAHAEIRYRER